MVERAEPRRPLVTADERVGRLVVNPRCPACGEEFQLGGAVELYVERDGVGGEMNPSSSMATAIPGNGLAIALRHAVC